jgi:NitT/TauT family transport system permease protein
LQIEAFLMQIPLPLVKYVPRPVRMIRRRESFLRRWSALISLVFALLFWQALVSLNVLPSYQLPAPATVWAEFTEWIANGKLWPHILTTTIEVLSGLAIGVSLALLLGYLIAHSPFLEDFVSPVVVALQSTPVVAYAPLLVIWFPGITSKTVTSSLIVFFPMLMSTVVSIRNVPEPLRNLMRVSQASRWDTLRKLEIPAALPVLLSGLKTAATLSVIGAVVGELVNASSGLGYLVRLGMSQYDTPLVFVAVILLASLALGLYRIVAILESRLLRWQQF